MSLVCAGLLQLPAAPIADWPRYRTDGTMRGRMARLNGKFGKLERQMQLIEHNEATLTSVDDTNRRTMRALCSGAVGSRCLS